MKQLAIVVALLIVMAAGIPPVVGTLAQNHLTQQTDVISENKLLAVNVRAYERGWLTSSVLLDIELSGVYQERLAEILTQGENQPASVTNLEERLSRTISLTVDLSHGPIIAEGGLRAGQRRPRRKRWRAARLERGRRPSSAGAKRAGLAAASQPLTS